MEQKHETVVFKVIIPYSVSKSPTKKFTIEYLIEAPDQQVALIKAEKEFFGYLQNASASWVRVIERDGIRIWRISPDTTSLASGDSPSYEILIENLGTSDPEILYRTLLALIQIGNPAAGIRILPCLRHPEELVASLAAEAIGKIGAKACLPQILEMFTSVAGNRLKASILSAIGRLACPEDPIQDILAQALADKDSRVRANAVETIEHLGITGSGKFLLPLLADADNRVRANVLKALWNSHDHDHLTRTLQGMVNDSNPWMRASGAFVLGHIDVENRLNMLSTLIDDAETPIQAIAARAFLAIGKPTCIPHLLSYLQKHHEIDPEPIFSSIERLIDSALPELLVWETGNGETNRVFPALWERLEAKVFQRHGWGGWLAFRVRRWLRLAI